MAKALSQVNIFGWSNSNIWAIVADICQIRGFMSDAPDTKFAADRLQAALRSLESALDPLVARVTELEKTASVAGDFEADRADLAGQLDDAAAREKALQTRDAEFQAREAEFNALADETTQELDRVISQVRQVLEQGT